MKKTFLIIFFSWLLFFIVIPPLHTPDEPEHYENTFWLSRFIYPYQPKNKIKPNLFVDGLVNTYFPFNPNTIQNSPLKHSSYTEKQIQKFQPITLQSYHPPFYYFLLSSSHHLANYLHLDLITRFYLTRLFSSLFYFGTVLLTYRILKILFAEKLSISAILLLFSLNPLVLKSAVGINPDNGMTFFSILFLYLIIKWQKAKVVTLKQTIILSLAAAASTLSKLSGIFTLMVFPIFVLIKNKLNKKLFLLYSLFLILYSILLFPWLLLNLNRYGVLSPPAFSFAEYKILQPHNIFQAMILSLFEFRHTIMHYAGFLGATNNISPPKFFFLSYAIAISIFTFTGFIFLVMHPTYRKKFQWIIVHFLSLVAFLFVLGTYFKKQGFSWDLQGRYFVPGFFSMTIFIYFGLLKLFKNNRRFVSGILLFFALIHFYYILFMVLLPFYYPFNRFFSNLGGIFIGALVSHVVLSFSITRRLFNPNSK